MIQQPNLSEQDKNSCSKTNKKCCSEINQLALKLQPYYSKSNVANKLLFTGHSHQVWPNVAFQGFKEYQDLVCQQVDKKWETIMAKLQILRGYLRDIYDDPDGLYCRESNTHYLVSAWISSLDLKAKPKIVTTMGEFHSMYRQLEIYNKHKIAEVVFVQINPFETLADRIISQIDQKTSCVFVSRVFFETGKINFGIKKISQKCQQKKVYMLVDDYHKCFTGGCNYLGWGEGNCFLRFPANYPNYPTLSGWFGAFQSLQRNRVKGEIFYDQGPARFASGTMEPVSIMRAVKVVQFFRQMQLTPQVLRKQYVNQANYLRCKFKELNLDANIIRLSDDLDASNFGGFVAFYSQKAQEICVNIGKHHLCTDYREKNLRFGLAPYITTQQIQKALEILSKTVSQLKN